MDRADAIAAALREVRAKHGPHALARGWSEHGRLATPARPDLPPWWPGQLPCIPRVVELAGPPSCGKLSLPTAGTIAVVDTDGRFYPPTAHRCGLDLRRLVVVRPPDARAATEATLLLLGSAGFDAVFWPLHARTRLSGIASAKLAQRATRNGTTLLTLVEHDGYRSRATMSPLAMVDARLAVARHEWRWEDGELAGVNLAVRGQVRGGAASEWQFVVDVRGERSIVRADRPGAPRLDSHRTAATG